MPTSTAQMSANVVKTQLWSRTSLLKEAKRSNTLVLQLRPWGYEVPVLWMWEVPGRVCLVAEDLRPDSFFSWALSVDDCQLVFPGSTTHVLTSFLTASDVFFPGMSSSPYCIRTYMNEELFSRCILHSSSHLPWCPSSRTSITSNLRGSLFCVHVFSPLGEHIRASFFWYIFVSSLVHRMFLSHRRQN